MINDGSGSFETVVLALVTGVPVLIGLAMCTVGVRAWRRARNLVTTGTQLTAVIVDNQLESQSDGQTLFRPVVRFRAPDGREMTTVLKNGQSHRSHLTNSQIDVLYDPADPDYVLRAGSTSGGGIGAIVAGVVFLGFGVLAYLLIGSMNDDMMFSGIRGWASLGQAGSGQDAAAWQAP